ncbi:hypothetical protein LJR231_003471 [Phyllobacterium sp. LjRoot231]|uniref:portal protein n=1 Tax=Phyllobacterium sp. LjRoot231 TaxID=3342289 RepID=UPI003ECE3517
MAKTKKMGEGELAALVRAGIDDAVGYDQSELSKHRGRALDYYAGRMPDVPHQEGRSQVTSRDVSDAMGWILPGLMRVFTASDTIVQYEPQTPEDEQGSSQATDYVNYVFMRECEGYRTLRNGFHEGLLFGNGIWKHWWDTSKTYETLDFSGLDDDAFTMLVSDDEVEVLQHTATVTVEMVADPTTGQPVEQQTVTHDCKIKRTCSYGKLVCVCIAPEEFLIQRGATSIEKATFADHRSMRTRQSLIDDGYDRKEVMKLNGWEDLDTTDEKLARWNRTVPNKNQSETDPLMVEVEVHEAYLRCDYDGDGYAEWRRVVMAGTGAGRSILSNDEWQDDLPFSDACPMPEPHRWEGRSLFDELEDVQKVKTVLLRQTLDNLYLSNNPQREAVANMIENMDEVINPTFGGVIQTTGPGAITDLAVPFVADKSYSMLEYMDMLSEKRTGVSRQSMALDPDALQNQTAAGQMMAQSASYAKIELYARNIAELGLKRLFKCLLKLVVAHQDKPRMIRLRDKWVEMDPRSWNANMDANVSVGLGSGSRDRDVTLLMQIAAKQELIIAQAGPTNPIVSLPQYANTLRKIVESAGIRSPDQYFNEVSQEDMQALTNQPPPPDPKVAAEQAKMEMEQQKAQAQIQIDQERAAASAELEQNKAAAAVNLQREKNALDMQSQREKAAAELQFMQDKAAAEIQITREKAAMDMQLRREEMLMEAELTSQANVMNAEVNKPKVDTNIQNRSVPED